MPPIVRSHLHEPGSQDGIVIHVFSSDASERRLPLDRTVLILIRIPQRTIQNDRCSIWNQATQTFSPVRIRLKATPQAKIFIDRRMILIKRATIRTYKSSPFQKTGQPDLWRRLGNCIIVRLIHGHSLSFQKVSQYFFWGATGYFQP